MITFVNRRGISMLDHVEPRLHDSPQFARYLRAIVYTKSFLIGNFRGFETSR